MAEPVYLVFGEDEYKVSCRAQEIVSQLVPEADRAFGLEIIDGRAESQDEALRAVGACLEAVATMGFMGARKVVWLKDATFFSGAGNLAKAETVKNAVSDMAQAIRGGLLPGNTLLVSASKVNKKLAIYKACDEKGQVHEFAMAEKSYAMEAQAMGTLDEILAKHGLRMNHAARMGFLDRVGTDSRQMANEIEKLAVFVGESGVADNDHMEAVTCSSRQALSWDLTGAFAEKDMGKCVRMLRRLLQQKQSAIGMVMGLERVVRELMVYREGLERGWLSVRKSGSGQSRASWAELPGDIEEMFSGRFERDPRSAHPFRISKLASEASGFSLQELRRCLRLIAEAYEQLVSSPVPETTILEVLFVRMLSTGVERGKASGRHSRA